jgi:putative hydroxymethylpyrimidine transport system substrate-binding protein
MRIAVLLIGLALAGIRATPAGAVDTMTVLLDWFVNPDHAALIVAKEGGYFARHGLDVSFVEPADPSAPPRLVAAGQGDLALTYQPTFYLAVAEGMPLQRIGTAIATPLNSLVVLADGPIRSIGDLRGKTIGYSVEGYETALLARMLQSAGLGLSDVKLVNVNFALTQALVSGQVDAVIGAYRNFELSELKLAGKPGLAFYPEDFGVPAYDELIFVTVRDKVAAPATRKFLDALEDATLFTLNHPEAAWDLFIKAYPNLDDELNRQAWRDTLPRLAASPAAVDPRRYSRFADFMKQSGLIATSLPVETYIGSR